MGKYKLGATMEKERKEQSREEMRGRLTNDFQT